MNLNYYNHDYSIKKQFNDFSNVLDVEDKETEDIKKEEYCDVKNATFKEINKLAKTLLDSKEIELNEYAKMVFDYSTLIPHIQKSNLRFNNKSAIQLENNAMFEGYNNEKHNWIELFEKKANQQFSLGNRVGGNSYIKIKNVLESISKGK